MTPEEAASLLVGKQIKEIKHHPYQAAGAMCVDEIVFTDGTVVGFCGCCDEGYIDDITLPDGTYHAIYRSEGIFGG